MVMSGLVREARLRPEAAHLYPGLTAGIWAPASEVGAKLLLMHLKASFAPTLGSRLLNDEHFEFRGGIDRGRSSPLRTRYGDESIIEH
jgi:hypothetical protein